MKRKALGKGIEAVIPSEIKEIFGEKTLMEIDIGDISPSELQPRKEFSPESLENLANSIKEQGVLQPLLLRKVGDKYEIIAGERRFRASQLAGLKRVPAITIEADTPQKALFISLVENIQREDLNALEEAEAYQFLCKNFKLKQEEIAKSVGKSRPAVANIMRLLKLPEKIKKMLKERKLTEGHARALLGIKDEAYQLRLANLIVKRGLSVERTEILAMADKGEKKRQVTKKVEPKILVLEKQLRLTLGTTVNIKKGKKGGQIVINFNSEEELYRIAGLLHDEE